MPCNLHQQRVINKMKDKRAQTKQTTINFNNDKLSQRMFESDDFADYW